MNGRIRLRRFSLLLAMLLGSMAMMPVASADLRFERPDSTGLFEEKAIALVSEMNAIPIERLEIRHSAIAPYHLTGENIRSFKVRDTQSGKYYSISLDERQNVVDVDRTAETGQAEYIDRYGKFSPDLYDKLQYAGPDENISVWIWMTEPENMPEIETDANDRQQEELRQSRIQMYLSHEKPVIDLLGSKGFEITYASKLSPSVFADLPGDLIRELSKRPDVVSIALSGSGTVELDSAAPSVKAPDVWSRGITGPGIYMPVISTTPLLPAETTASPASTRASDSGVRVFTDHESYYIGGVVTFGIENNGIENIKFVYGAPIVTQIKQNDTWVSFRAYGVNMGPTENLWYVHPGETKTFLWDTGRGCQIAGEERETTPPGRYRIVFEGGFASNEFTLLERPEGEPAVYNVSTFSDGSRFEIFTDDTSYSAGDVVTFWMINTGAREGCFPSSMPLEIQMKTNDTWTSARSEFLPCTDYYMGEGWRLQPGEKKTYWWDTGGKKCESRLEEENMNAPPGRYRIVLRFGTYKGPIEFVSGEFIIL
ncbi:MAG: serine protease AprX [Methanofollis sp.]|nr:serine protease AprX [Methanofollis sp.]